MLLRKFDKTINFPTETVSNILKKTTQPCCMDIIKNPIIVHPIKTNSIREPIHRNPFDKISSVLPKNHRHYNACVWCVCSKIQTDLLSGICIWVQIFRVTNKTNSIRNRDTFPIPQKPLKCQYYWDVRFELVWPMMKVDFIIWISNWKLLKYIIPFDFPFKSIILTHRSIHTRNSKSFQTNLYTYT